MKDALFSIWKWLNENGTALGVLLAVVPLVWTAISYLRQKKKELAQQRFEVYHRLIDELVRGRPGGPFLDSQIAVVFELRRFPEYYQVSRRILRHLRVGWSQKPTNQPLIEEMDLALTFIRKKAGRAES